MKHEGDTAKRPARKPAREEASVKYRVDLVLFDLQKMVWEHKPGWEFDGERVRPLCWVAEEYRRVGWKKWYTPEDGMDFMRALHYGVYGTFVTATHPYRVAAGDGADGRKGKSRVRKLVEKSGGATWTYSVEGKGANRTICLWGGRRDSCGDEYWIIDNVQMEAHSYAPPDRIADGAFAGIVKMEGLKVPFGVRKIGPWAFEKCTGMRGVKLPDRLEDIGDYAFCLCRRLKAVAIPDTVTHLGEGAFAHCESLVEVTLGKGLKEIEPGTFEGCGMLEEITIPDNVERIGSVAFGDCGSLAKIRFGAGIRSIAPDAFRGCAALQEIVLPPAAERIPLPLQGVRVREAGGEMFL